MKTKCPACGATTSLDALLGHSEASKAFVASLNLTGALAKPLVMYLAMFRSENRDLTFDRTAKLLNEIAPDIVAKQIKRGHHTYPAPQSAWVWAINIMLERREQQKIDLPLKTHGYLYEVISSYKPENAPVQADQSGKSRSTPNLKTQAEIEADQREHERRKHEKPAISFADLMRQTQEEKKQIEMSSLKNIPQNQVFAFVDQNRLEGESHKQCFDRLKAAELAQEQSTQGK
ncbi:MULTISPECIES: hypothetical protein [Acinetobacter]|uniref:DUF2752 domain-containing protein n=1 Tax=Acinetobacter nematophilus TaxID=2994642 RepID=A0A9X3IFV8_9GAMM|nr:MULTISPECIES: hypothetical protein [Acinetobacter]MBJ8477201.1 DUF2752 domain-containing protein [Acinetobacter bereziniae]MCX5466521.1 DUF2752 domain-containing protein [Acinetobacter nematophilus]